MDILFYENKSRRFFQFYPLLSAFINEMNEKKFKNIHMDHSNQNNNCQKHVQLTWTKLRLLKKCQFCRNKKSHEQHIYSILLTKYALSNNYYYSNNIAKVFIKESKNKTKSILNSLQYDEPVQHIKQYFSMTIIKAQIADLIDYYKYYGQKPILFIESFFDILYTYQERKKIIQYNRLKVLLSLDPTQSGNCSQLRSKPNHNNFNILDEINISSENEKDDESLMVLNLRDKLSRYLTNTKPLTLQEIDRNFLNSSSTFDYQEGLRNAIYQEKAFKNKHVKRQIQSKLKSKAKSINNISHRQVKHHKKNNYRSMENLPITKETSKKKINLKSQQSASSKQQISAVKNKQIPIQIKAKIAQFKCKIRKQKQKLLKSLRKSLESFEDKKYRVK